MWKLVLAGALARAAVPPLAAQRDADRAAPTVTGRWTARLDEGDSLALQLHRRSRHGWGNRDDWTMGRAVPLARFQGLSAGDATRRGEHAVHFVLAREAGRFAFDGSFDDGEGGGTYAFTPDPAYLRALAARGWRDVPDDDLFVLAAADVTSADLRTYERLGYGGMSLDELVRMTTHGADAEFAQGIHDAGYPRLTTGGLVRMRDHGVDPEYIAALGRAGYRNLDADAVVRARDHGVDPEYLARFAQRGGQRLDLEQVIELRDHGVDAHYVDGLAQVGYRDVGLDQVRQARDHGVTPEYVRELADAGLRDLSLGTVIRLRDHGVTPGFVADLRKAGYDDLDAEHAIRLRDRGITAEDLPKAHR
jgi:DUF971 family protein